MDLSMELKGLPYGDYNKNLCFDPGQQIDLHIK